MLNIADTLRTWCREQRPFALATITSVTGSAPLPVGTSLAVDATGHVVGSISGGCVEAAVYDLCRRILDDQGGAQRERFGYSDDDAFAIGLTCGGELDVLIQRIIPADQPHLGTALTAAIRGHTAAVVQVVEGPETLLGALMALDEDGHVAGGNVADSRTDAAVADRARAQLRRGATARITLGGRTDACPEELSVLVHVAAPPPRMLVFGAVDFAAALAQAGRFLGYQVTVCDARPVFATRERFPHADDIVIDWPHRYLERTAVDTRTAVCVLTHDPRFDIPLLRTALRLPLGYVGAMGSRRTHHERMRRLRQAGLSAAELTSLHSPIGLDLGARTPEETAISITSEIIAHTHNASGRPLTHGDGAIHQPSHPCACDHEEPGGGDRTRSSDQGPAEPSLRRAGRATAP
ncbi:XdhC family protein [Streptomyces sp. NPDC085931]|uniref:XdhC family protein n=1 Tax=Streptomyces sp. NPDC085931 TaxID=3365740 RepID=UPI0037D955E1